jgi:hypothetical protein
LRLPHDLPPLAWVACIDKSWGGKKGLLGLEKLDAFDSIGLSVQVMKSSERAICLCHFFRFYVNQGFDMNLTSVVKLV